MTILQPEHVQKILHATTTAAASFLLVNALLATLVVLAPLVLVAQNVVGFKVT